MQFELTGRPKTEMHDFFRAVFAQRYDSFTVDMTLSNSPDYVFYKNLFNRLEHVDTNDAPARANLNKDAGSKA